MTRIQLGFFAALLALATSAAAGQAPVAPGTQEPPVRVNMVGAYGPWLADQVLGNEPGRLSIRTGKWTRVEDWRNAARQRVLECIAPVDLGGLPAVTVTSRQTYDGLDIEFLSWQLPAGPRTEAVFLKPSGAKGPLPGILALHDHGGNKFLGWRKIVRTGGDFSELQDKHQANYYGGAAWANEIAKRGYAVLVHDTFPFASRRVNVKDVPPRIQAGGVEPSLNDPEAIAKYNAFAAAHENIMEKSLISAGTTWPGVYLVEDQRALDVLASRPEVDPARLGCAGLSGGGMRTVFLGGLDERIKVAVAVGFMTTWRDFLLDKCFTHTWMTYVPLLPRDLDFPEILALRAPAATLVLNSREDPLFTLAEMQRADGMLRETFARARAGDRYRCNFYDGGHKFDRAMQTDAFDWFDRFLRPERQPVPPGPRPHVELQGIYGGYPDELVQTGTPLREFGINAVFVSSGQLAADRVARLHDQGVRVFAEFNSMHRAAYLKTHPEAAPVGADGQISPPPEGWQGICPSHEGYRSETMAEFRRVLRDYDIDGIWLDYHHSHASWERAEPVLPDTCFCTRCLRRFQAETGVVLPDRPVPELAKALLTGQRARWVQWRCDLFTGWVREYREIVRQVRPQALLGTYHCPWSEADFNGALREKLAIDLKGQAPYIDVFSPMPYHARFGHARDPGWISRQTSWLGKFLGIEGQPGERLRIWPIVQLSDWGETVPVEQVDTVIDYGSRLPATGVMVFAWGSLRKQPEKVEAMGRAYRAFR